MAVVFLPIGGEIEDLLWWLTVAGLRVGVPGSNFYGYDFALNMVLFAVPTVLVAAAWPSVRRWIWLIAAFVLSFTIETVQDLALPRTASLMDLAANSLGALLGLCGLWVVERLNARRTARRAEA
nr:VanZ family protein [Tessaracoccus sp. OS52]